MKHNPTGVENVKKMYQERIISLEEKIKNLDDLENLKRLLIDVNRKLFTENRKYGFFPMVLIYRKKLLENEIQNLRKIINYEF